jgi:transposase
MQRTKYALEFKDEAVKQVIDKGHTVVDVAKRLGIPDNVLYTWVSKFKKADQPESSDLKAMQAEVAKLKAELRRTTEERDILKKAALSSTGRCNTNLIECCYRRSSIWRKEVGRDFPQSRKKTCGSDGKMVNL